MKKIFNIAAIAALAFIGVSCTLDADKFEYGKNIVMMTGTGESPLVKLAVGDNPPASYNVTVSATDKMAQDAEITLHVGDTAALSAYNKSHGSSYKIVPEKYYKVSSKTIKIAAETAVSEACTITLDDFSFIENGVHYMIPVSIENVQGTDFEVLESSRTVFIRLARTISFYALSMDDIGLYSEYQFADDKAIELPVYTYEIKCYPTNLKHDGAEQICRLCTFTGPEGGGRQNMLRFNENGRPWRSLQIVTPSGGDYTTTTIFEENQWYMLSMVYDGSTYQLYINGEPDGTTLTSDEHTLFQRVELGMSWTSYGSSQSFAGRICEMRVWDYPRSKSQIQGSLCGVDPASEGLRAYWKFNQSSGTTFFDETGNGYDMDWTKSVKEFTDGQGNQPNPSAANHIVWVKDNVNKCSE